MKTIVLTELEKKVLKEMIDEGYFYDDLDDRFICWGIDGKKERGAISSLIKKKIILIDNDDLDTYVWAMIPKREILELVRGGE